MVSAQPKLTDLVTIHGIKPPVRRDRSRSRSRDRGRGAGRGRSRSRDRGRGSRSRSRSRDRDRSRDGAVHRHSRSGSRSRERHRSHQRSSSRDRSRSRGRDRRSERSEERAAYRDRSRDRDRARYRDRSGSRERDRRRDRSRDASRERGRGRDKSSIGGGGSGSAGAGASRAAGSSGGHSTAAAAARAGSGAGASAGSGSALGAVAKSETPQERLKRIMAVQLTKQAQKDQAVTHVKRMQVCGGPGKRTRPLRHGGDWSTGAQAHEAAPGWGGGEDVTWWCRGGGGGGGGGGDGLRSDSMITAGTSCNPSAGWGCDLVVRCCSGVMRCGCCALLGAVVVWQCLWGTECGCSQIRLVASLQGEQAAGACFCLASASMVNKPCSQLSASASCITALMDINWAYQTFLSSPAVAGVLLGPCPQVCCACFALWVGQR